MGFFNTSRICISRHRHTGHPRTAILIFKILQEGGAVQGYY